MKHLFLIVILGSIGCSKISDTNILGIWQVQSPYYKATYAITHTKEKLVGKVIYYNDGTTILHETGTAKDIFLKNLKYKNGMYVDAISGATKTTGNTTQLLVKHRDTLLVTNYVHHKPLTEIWTRKQ
ncbi:hypothetical protein [Tenacibaculum amylolyticum]|uniref:hypothetical protein n=1 Tax=Tenacibaculum amylolyticum TaxID=104269 RepID=UPI00389354D2